MFARSGLFMRLRFFSIPQHNVIIEARRQFLLVLKTDGDAFNLYDEPITYSLSSYINKKKGRTEFNAVRPSLRVRSMRSRPTQPRIFIGLETIGDTHAKTDNGIVFNHRAVLDFFGHCTNRGFSVKRPVVTHLPVTHQTNVGRNTSVRRVCRKTRAIGFSVAHAIVVFVELLLVQIAPTCGVIPN